MELWAFYVGLVLLVGLFVRYYSMTGFSLHFPTISGFQTIEQAPERVYKPESWCLLSETVLGRTCVRNDACAPTARFSSEDACMLSEASALPLGTTRLDQYYTPFMSRIRQTKTF